MLLYHHISNSTSWLSFFIGILWKTTPNSKFKIWIWTQIWFLNMPFGKYSVVWKLEVKKNGGFCSAFCEMSPASLEASTGRPASGRTTARPASLAASTAHVHCHWEHLLIDSVYCTSSIISSIYCTSSIILASTASPASLATSTACPASSATSTARQVSLAAFIARPASFWLLLRLQRNWQHLLHVQHHWQHLLHVKHH